MWLWFGWWLLLVTHEHVLLAYLKRFRYVAPIDSFYLQIKIYHKLNANLHTIDGS